jgi:hypothetical protein
MPAEERQVMAKAVNRSCLIVSPAKGYVDWARSCPGGHPGEGVVDPGEAGTVYLIPEPEAGPEKWLAKNYRAIFENELEAWYQDESAWPQDRSLKAFKTFFDVRFCSMVLDMGKEPLETE